jgi:PAS domain S-box-containing protein/putative nucleotidyltransferase with HDIG domain
MNSRDEHPSGSYALLSEVAHAILHEHDPALLLDAVCRIAVTHGGYSLAWIGLASNEGHHLDLVAKDATAEGSIDDLEIRIDVSETGRGPSATAFRTGTAVVIEDFETDPRVGPWRDTARERGIRSGVTLPIPGQTHTLGTLNLYAPDPNHFDAEHLAVLGELTAEIGYALDTASAQRRREYAEERLRVNERLLTTFVEFAPAAIAMFDNDMRYLAVSRRYLADYNLDGDVIGKTHYEVFPEIPQSWREIHRRCLDGEVLRAEEDPFPRADGTLDWVRWEIRPWHEEGEVIGGIILFSEVITARKAAECELRASNERLERLSKSITAAMGRVVEARDPYTKGHEERVAVIARAIAVKLGMDEHDVEGIEVAALVHDIGKLSVPSEILNKPGKLSPAEFDVVRWHSEAGYEILKDLEFDWPIAEMVLQHHERMDATGYPRGLSGDEILTAARVIAVADVIEAMASHRPYRPTLGVEAAISELTEHSAAFDPQIVEAAVELLESGRLSL